MTPDGAFRLLVESNPIPDLETVPEALGLGPDRLPTVRPGRVAMQVQKPTRITPTLAVRPRRWLPVAAALFVAISVAVAAVVLTEGGEDTADLSPAARREAAIDTAREFIAAINAGEVDRLIDMSNPTGANLVADRNMWEFNAVGTGAGYEMSVGECAARATTSDFVLVECDVTTAEPVQVALGAEALVFPIRVWNDGSTHWQPFEGIDIGAVAEAYADYLQAFHPADYAAVCSPGAYEVGSITSNRGLALTGDCARLSMPLSADVAAWIADGRPAP